MLSCNHKMRPLELLSFQLLQLAMRMAVHGTLASFDLEVEDWTEYTDQLSYYSGAALMVRPVRPRPDHFFYFKAYNIIFNVYNYP